MRALPYHKDMETMFIDAAPSMGDAEKASDAVNAAVEKSGPWLKAAAHAAAILEFARKHEDRSCAGDSHDAFEIIPGEAFRQCILTGAPCAGAPSQGEGKTP